MEKIINTELVKHYIADGNGILGIEFGSTRIKAVLVNSDGDVLAQGSHQWENQLFDNIWTYSLDSIWNGLRNCYKDLTTNIKQLYNVELISLSALGFSGMMHGYMPFDKKDELLVPFRTWRNTITEDAADKLTKAFNFNIPQRWSIAHLYQAILDNEAHIDKVSYFTTLSGYIHWMLTGKKVLGIGEASGMFPIDADTKNYNSAMLDTFDRLIEERNESINKYVNTNRVPITWNIRSILPEVLCAGQTAGTLTPEGALLLDPTGTLKPGCILAPPEGDAGTGMVATNSIRKRTGNVSSGTSVFAMVVLENALSQVHKQIDIVTTPVGDSVAMVHCNNCTSDINAWVKLFKEFATVIGSTIDDNKIYQLLFNKALEGSYNCGGLMTYNYFSGEPITNMPEGRPMLIRCPDSTFSIANLMRANMYSALATLKIGMDILLQSENVQLDKILGHGGFYKTPVAGQKITAAALNVPVSVMSTAGEGGAWGIAILATYTSYCSKSFISTDDITYKSNNISALDRYLSDVIFAEQQCTTIEPDALDVESFNIYIKDYKKGLAVEKAAIENYHA